MKHAIWIAVLAVLMSSGAANAQTTEGKRDGVYQIVKATEDRVWRLNTETGEIAVCALAGENLVCTSTSDAAEVPKKSYAEIEAERTKAADAAKAKRAAEREQELKFLDKLLALFRELLQTAMGSAPSS